MQKDFLAQNKTTMKKILHIIWILIDSLESVFKQLWAPYERYCLISRIITVVRLVCHVWDSSVRNVHFK